LIEQFNEKVFIPDFNELKPETKQLLSQGVYKISSAYKTIHSSDGKIVEHIPFKEKVGLNGHSLVQCADMANKISLATNMSLAISTGVVVVAVAISTMVVLKELEKLEEKMDRMQQSLEEIKSEINNQARINETKMAIEYIAEIKSLREVLRAPEENEQEIKSYLIDLRRKRHYIILYLNWILNECYPSLSPERKAIAIESAHPMMKLLPAATYMEYDATIGLKKINSAQNLKTEFLRDYFSLDIKYKKVLNDNLRLYYINYSGEHIQKAPKLAQDYKNYEKLNNNLLTS